MACRTSIENLAAWAKIQVPQEECRILEQARQQFQHDQPTYHQKILFLRRWLGIAEPVIKKLGKYPCQF